MRDFFGFQMSPAGADWRGTELLNEAAGGVATVSWEARGSGSTPSRLHGRKERSFRILGRKVGLGGLGGNW